MIYKAPTSIKNQGAYQVRVLHKLCWKSNCSCVLS